MTDETVERIAKEAEAIFHSCGELNPIQFGTVMSTVISVYLQERMVEDGWEKWLDLLHQITLRRARLGHHDDGRSRLQ